ncbi:MAG: hypothetical protein LBD66_00205, partial [Holosporales bacterium]|nr:hypothetical protein [Holosporales bacterium]
MFIKDDIIQGVRFLQKEIVNYIITTTQRWQRRIRPFHSPKACRAFFIAFKHLCFGLVLFWKVLLKFKKRETRPHFAEVKWTLWVVARRLLLSLCFLGRLLARIGKQGKNHLQNLFLRHLVPYSKVDVFVMGFASMLALTLIMLVVQLRYYETTIFKINEDRQYLLNTCGQALRERDQHQISLQGKEDAIKILLRKHQELTAHEETLKQQLAERDEVAKKLEAEKISVDAQKAAFEQQMTTQEAALKQQLEGKVKECE